MNILVDRYIDHGVNQQGENSTTYCAVGYLAHEVGIPDETLEYWGGYTVSHLYKTTPSFIDFLDMLRNKTLSALSTNELILWLSLLQGLNDRGKRKRAETLMHNYLVLPENESLHFAVYDSDGVLYVEEDGEDESRNNNDNHGEGDEA